MAEMKKYKNFLFFTSQKENIQSKQNVLRSFIYLYLFYLFCIFANKNNIFCYAFVMQSSSRNIYIPPPTSSVCTTESCSSSSSPPPASYLLNNNYNIKSNMNKNDKIILNMQKNEEMQTKSVGTLSDKKLGGRVPFVGGNWKCNGNKQSVRNLVDILNQSNNDIYNHIQVVVSPPSLHVDYVQSNLRGDVKVATQDVSIHNDYGAYTGELCAKMIKDFGVDWTIVGHSERRAGFGINGETDEVVGKKVKSALSEGLNVIACIGEKLSDREAGRTLDVIQTQLKSIIENVGEDEWHRVVLAYEPVWAIGTGKTATPDMAQAVHKSIREMIGSEVSERAASGIRILYGGSVKGSNSASLISESDIDGFLVGGASLNTDFVKILEEILHTKKKQESEMKTLQTTANVGNQMRL